MKTIARVVFSAAIAVATGVNFADPVRAQQMCGAPGAGSGSGSGSGCCSGSNCGAPASAKPVKGSGSGSGSGAEAKQKGKGSGSAARAGQKGDQSASSKAYNQANIDMHKGMDIRFTGDADVDFVRGMVPHHQGAVAMAKIVLEYGRDPELKKLAEEIVKAQETEIALMNDWLARKGK